MKAVLQNFRNGRLSVSEIPPPACRPGGVLVSTSASLISGGTERSVIELARMNPLQKAKARPDLVRKVLDRAGQEGLLGTARIVLNLLSTPVPLGYSCAGIVREVGQGAGQFRVGDRVACAGIGYANHAEVVWVPKNLAVKVPEGVGMDEAAFATLGAIALQGVRQADLALGDRVAVIGLGLVGQLVSQLCLANGCRVFGIDLDPGKVGLALTLGANEARVPDVRIASRITAFTSGLGVDAVIIAAATKSSAPVELAAEIARDRARVIALGDVSLDLPRRKYYEKELELRLSRSSGPGRYDRTYEERGVDYPPGYVRWTENRNMSAFLELVQAHKVNVRPLISHRFPIERATEAYGLISESTNTPHIGVLLEYAHADVRPPTIQLRVEDKAGTRRAELRLGVIGAGQFAQGVLLPIIHRIPGTAIVGVATLNGITARAVADKYGAKICTSDHNALLNDPEVDAVVIATRHDLHASLVADAIRARKSVFVEKPLAINRQQLSDLAEAFRLQAQSSDALPTVLVGYNRRFSPLAKRVREAMSGRPLVVNCRINAGPLPQDSWVLDSEIGGGRIVGEVCHFVDLLQFLTDARPVEVVGQAARKPGEPSGDPEDVCFLIRFDDGSIGSVTYVSTGDPRFPKERIEVLGGGMVAVIDNWRRLEIRGNRRSQKIRSWLTAAKGHSEELRVFTQSVASGRQPVPIESFFLTTECTFAMQDSLRSGMPVQVSWPGMG